MKKEIKQNCNDNKIVINGNKIIKFENCTIDIENQIFINDNQMIVHHINPVYLKEIHNENEVQEELTINTVNFKNIENRNMIEKSNKVIVRHNILLYITTFGILTIFAVIFIYLIHKFILQKKACYY